MVKLFGFTILPCGCVASRYRDARGIALRVEEAGTDCLRHRVGLPPNAGGEPSQRARGGHHGALGVVDPHERLRPVGPFAHQPVEHLTQLRKRADKRQEVIARDRHHVERRERLYGGVSR